MAGDDVTITVTANSQQAQRAFRDLKKEVRGLKGTLVPLATAAVPALAAMGAATAKAAGQTLGATAAVASFGIAVAGQVSHLSDASKAQDKYNQAVFQYGVGSKQAAEAQRTMAATMAAMPQATARASVALSTLKDGFKSWSDDMSSFTMVPVEKSFVILGQLVPRLTDMTKGASSQLNRLVTTAGGAIATPGFDALTDKVSTFANQSLKEAVDGIIHFSRALSQGEANGPVQAFMDYAHSNGPALRETLTTIGDAVTTLVEASADAGPGMLTLVNAAAGLVAAMPPSLVATIMQLAVALKVVTLAGRGAAAMSAGLGALGARIMALQAASAAAGGGMAGLSVAFATLGRAAKATLIASGIGLVVLALSELSDMGKKAPPDVEKLTTSLRTLGQTGKVTGEAARSFGKDLSGFADSLEKVVDPKGLDQVQQSIMSFFGTDSTPVKDAKENIDAIDKSLANLVKGGHADLAASALATLSKKMKEEGYSASEVKGQLDDYKSALADQAFEQELAAQSMGTFGQAAQDTTAALAEGQRSADGFRASILALNEVARSGYEAQIGFEQALDDLTASFKEHGATLDIDTEAGRANGEAMLAAAKAQDELIASGLAAGDSLASMKGKSDELRASMMALAVDAFDGNKAKATEYVNTLLGVPGHIETQIKLEREEAVAGLESVRAAIAATPNEHEVRVDTLNGAAIAALEAVGLKTRQLPDGKTAVYTANGRALGNIGAVSSALNTLDGKTANTYVTTTYTKAYRDQRAGERAYTNRSAQGGLLRRYAGGGDVQMAPNGLVSGPGTGTSDSIYAMFASGAEGLISDTEYVVNARSTRKHLPLLEAINNDRLPRFAKGGLTDAQKQARKDAMSDLTISHFGQMAGYKRSEFRSELGSPDSISSLVNALNEWRSNIKKATSGKTEKTLLKNLDMWGNGLIKWQKQLNTVTKSLEKARDKLDSLKDAAASLAGNVKSGILSSANITRGAGGDTPTTVASVMGGLTESRDKASAFAKALKELKKKGLSAALIQQIAEAGIEGGGLETAGALLGASSSEIDSMNDLQKQIGSSATSAGKTTADAVYGKAIAAQERYVKSLESQQKKLTTSMDRLAAKIEKIIERSFGKKAAGGIVGAAASGGIRSNLTWVGEEGPELVDLAPGSRVWSNPDSRRKAAERAPWASMLNTPRGGSGVGRWPVASPGGGDGQPLVVQLRIGERDFGELWVDVGRREVRARGSIEATLKPPRGR